MYTYSRFEKLLVFQLLKKRPVFYIAQRLITAYILSQDCK